MKKKIQYKIMQVIANYVIYMLKNAHNDDMFNYYFELGCKLDAYAIEFHDIHLVQEKKHFYQEIQKRIHTFVI